MIKNYKKQNGFTLVELAIVLMIIGLLVGGVLRGQELLQNSRVAGTIQQIKAYNGAFVTFRNTYAALPGDMVTATNRVPGCVTGQTTICGNGNGDGIIGQPANYGHQTGTTALPQVETSYFWKHLAMANLITGVDPSVSIARADWGKTHPASKIGAGGYVVFYSTQANDWGVGHRLRLQIGPGTTGGRGTSPLSPILAKRIDDKMDDGKPSLGDVTADSHGSECNDETTRAGTYLNTDSKNCIMYFNIE